MLHRNVWRSAIVLVAIISVCVPASAQDEPYARVSEWDISRAQWGGFVKYLDDNYIPILERFFDEGTVIEWGFTTASLHSPDGYSHTIWYSTRTMADIEKVGRAFDEKEGSAPIPADIGNAVQKHRDSLVRSLIFESRPGKLDGGYTGGSVTQTKAGQAGAYLAWWKKHIQPVYDGLLQDGTVLSYGVDVEQVIQNSPFQRSTWYVLRDAEGLDKVRASFAKHFGERSEAELAGIFGQAIDEMTVRSARRTSMSQIIHYATK